MNEFIIIWTESRKKTANTPVITIAFIGCNIPKDIASDVEIADFYKKIMGGDILQINYDNEYSWAQKCPIYDAIKPGNVFDYIAKCLDGKVDWKQELSIDILKWFIEKWDKCELYGIDELSLNALKHSVK